MGTLSVIIYQEQKTCLAILQKPMDPIQIQIHG